MFFFPQEPKLEVPIISNACILFRAKFQGIYPQVLRLDMVRTAPPLL